MEGDRRPASPGERRTDGDELTYSRYIAVPEILRAQRLPEEVPRGRTREEWPTRPTVTDAHAPGGTRPWREGDRWPDAWPHDEHLFIVTHQTFELWFRQILHDLDDVMDRVTAVLTAHGASLPRVEPLAREASHAVPLRRVLDRLPRTAAVVSRLSAGDAWERRWVQELHAPAAFPVPRDPSVGALHLAWFDDATLDLVARRLRRAATILRHATGAFDILASMPPEEFLAFRSRLNPASGFGSTQFRELECLLGMRDAIGRRLDTDGDLSFARHMPADEVTRIRERHAAPSFRDLVYALLGAPDVRGDDALLAARADAVMAANLELLHADYEIARTRGAASDTENHLHAQWRGVDEILTHAENVTLCALYERGTHPGLRDVLERAFELDDALRAWRHAHVPMVERMIGSRPGTGGGGIAYLAVTLRAARAFPALWEFRSILARTG